MMFSVPFCLPLCQAYSLKDYNQLQLNISLRGLGPDYKAVEEAVSPGLHLQSSQDWKNILPKTKTVFASFLVFIMCICDFV